MKRPTFTAKGFVWGRADEERPYSIRVMFLKRGHVMTKMGVVFELAERVRQTLPVVAHRSLVPFMVTA